MMEAISKEITNDEAAEMLFNRIKEKDRIENVKHLDFYNDAFDILREEKKGLLLIGGVGTGKTAFFNSVTQTPMIRCSELAMKYSMNGGEAFKGNVSSNHYDIGWIKPGNKIYDDLERNLRKFFTWEISLFLWLMSLNPDMSISKPIKLKHILQQIWI
jgi:hypothetical protein